MIRSDSDELLDRILNEQLASDHQFYYYNKQGLIPTKQPQIETEIEATTPVKDNTLSSSFSSSSSRSSLPSLASLTSSNNSPRQQTLFQRILFIMHLLFAFFVVLWFITVFLVKSSIHTPNESTYKMAVKLFDDESTNSFNDSIDQYGINYGAEFPKGCVSPNRIIDSHDGNLTHIHASTNANQFTFVYLYANWCARSMHYRRLIEQLVCEHPQISFIAVNCFSSKGECRKTFNLLRYPQIIVHTRDIGFLVYKGPFEYAYLTNYLGLVKKPLERIDNFEEFVDFVLLNDRVVLGNFNFSNKVDANLYNTFYQASIKSLNLDSENPIRYGVIVNKNLWRRINKFSVKPSKTQAGRKIVAFSVYGLEKGVKSFKGRANADYIVNWAYRYLRPTINWYYPDRIQTKRNDINEFLVFYPRNFTNADNKLKNIQLTLKMLLLESYYNLYHFGPSLFYIVLKESYLGRKSCYGSDPMSFLANGDLFVDRMWCDKEVALGSEKFFLETSLSLIDSNLYSNYASSLLRTSKTASSSFPFSLLIDHKNESLLIFEDEFNFANMKKFVKNQEYGLNRRFLKSNAKQSSRGEVYSSSIENVDSKRLISIFGHDNNDFLGLYHNKDLLIFYYNNWCGFCNLVNHKLVILSQQFFKNVDTFKIIKIDVSTNDLPWNIHVNRVPSLLFIPASSDSSKSTIRDSIAYDLTSNVANSLEVKHLAQFVLENARNTATLSSFLRENFLNAQVNRKLASSSLSFDGDFDLSESSKLRYDLINLVAKKTKNLRIEISSLEHGYFNQTINRNDDQEFTALTDFYLKLKLNRLFFELDVLKNFTSLFKN